MRDFNSSNPRVRARSRCASTSRRIRSSTRTKRALLPSGLRIGSLRSASLAKPLRDHAGPIRHDPAFWPQAVWRQAASADWPRYAGGPVILLAGRTRISEFLALSARHSDV